MAEMLVPRRGRRGPGASSTRASVSGRIGGLCGLEAELCFDDDDDDDDLDDDGLADD